MHTLYLKTHNKTGLHYLGYFGSKTNKFETYKGSGVRWNRHLEKHGNDVTTKVLCQASTSVERDGRMLAPKWFDDVCLEFSKMLNVVDNPSFANLCHETGSINTSLGYKSTQNCKDKIRIKATGRIFTKEDKSKMSEKKMGENNPKYDPNSLRQIYQRASEAGEYPYTYEAFIYTYNKPNHSRHQLVLDLVQKFTIKEKQ